jgi:glucose-6-phosphate 1-dehydrogenase
VVVEFKKVPHILYNLGGELDSNKLIISIQPDEKITMQFNVKGPQGKVSIASAEFDHKKQFNSNSPEAYENILHSIIGSDVSMFTRWDGVEKS